MQYGEENRSQFDAATQSRLDALVERFGSVEIQRIAKANQWCVRATATTETEEFPLAALGNTLFEAAKRLLVIGAFRETAGFDERKPNPETDEPSDRLA